MGVWGSKGYGLRYFLPVHHVMSCLVSLVLGCVHFGIVLENKLSKMMFLLELGGPVCGPAFGMMSSIDLDGQKVQNRLGSWAKP